MSWIHLAIGSMICDHAAMSRYDVIVIGVGAMGAAACAHAARRGASVLGLERHTIPHTLGSSGGETRLIRLSYFEHPNYVPLLRRAYANWDDLGDLVGEALLVRTGALYLGRPEGTLISGSRRAAERYGIEHSMLSQSEVRERCGPFRIPEGFVAMYEPSAGFVRCQRAILRYAELASRHGAALRSGETVLRWESGPKGVTVMTDQGRYEGGKLVLVAGSWTSELLHSLPVPLTVTRQPLFWIVPPDPVPFRLGRFCCWALQGDAPHFQGIHYGFPILEGQSAFKLGRHLPGMITTPDKLERNVQPSDFDEVRPVFDAFLPSAKGPLEQGMVCMYTNSPDGHFIVDRHPQEEHVVLACGFSGHGFKFASVMGEALADLALDGRTPLPIAFLGLSRFAGRS